MQQKDNKPYPATQTTLRKLPFWILYCAAAPAAALQAISLSSLFAGHPAVGALQAFGLFALLVGVPAFLLAPAESRHRLLSRLLTAFSVFGVLSLFALRGKAAQLQSAGETTARVAFTPTLVVLLIQLGLAAAYLLRSRSQTHARRQSGVPWWSWGPAVLLVPVLLVGGFLGSSLFGWGPARTQGAASLEPGQEKFSHFPKPADFEFAQETDRAGEDFGGDFIHYHTGQQPLVGFVFSDREWFRHMRISDDLRGIFDRDTVAVGDHVMLAEPGYVVAGLEAQVDKHVHAIRIQFARLNGFGLDMTDSYWSRWTTGFNPALKVVSLGSTGELVLGITGTAGLVVNSLAVMIETPALSEKHPD